MTRKLGQRMQITTPTGEVIWLEVVRSTPTQLGIGVTAAAGVKVRREELLPEGERFAATQQK